MMRGGPAWRTTHEHCVSMLTNIGTIPMLICNAIVDDNSTLDFGMVAVVMPRLVQEASRRSDLFDLAWAAHQGSPCDRASVVGGGTRGGSRMTLHWLQFCRGTSRGSQNVLQEWC